VPSQREWTQRRLWDLADYVNGRPTKPAEVTNSGVAVIKIAELTGGITPRTDRVSARVVLDKHWVEDGDLLFAWSGSVGVHVYHGPRAALNQHIFRVEARPGIDQRFLRYLLEGQLSVFQGFVENKKTTMGHVTIKDLHNIRVLVPPLDEQRRIAHILGTLDDKIELNRQMSETLEAMARALFKSWLVDFDPVRAKSEGRDLGLPQPLADLFPGRLLDSAIGEIPAGWQLKGLDEVANYLNGLALQKYPPDDDGSLPIIKIAQLRAGHTIGADHASSRIPSDYVVENGDVLFSWSGSLEVEMWCGGPGALNQHVFKVTSDRYPKWFYFLWTRQYLDEFRGIAAGKATTMGHIQRGHLSSALAVTPPPRLLNAMDEYVGPILQRLECGRLEARTLAALRHTLLPRLLTGEISPRLPEASPA
jgi:type I restriction enzyme S subunit